MTPGLRRRLTWLKWVHLSFAVVLVLSTGLVVCLAPFVQTIAIMAEVWVIWGAIGAVGYLAFRRVARGEAFDQAYYVRIPAITTVAALLLVGQAIWLWRSGASPWQNAAFGAGALGLSAISLWVLYAFARQRKMI
ncbi:MAG: hypothetical protein MUQ65_12080 [Armatimonadetes bacterium]|nr:hypothetical protein [Armatimonadota bacterium]